VDPLTLDTLDEQLIHALQVDGRATFNQVAAVLGASDRTVARRHGPMAGPVDYERIWTPGSGGGALVTGPVPPTCGHRRSCAHRTVGSAMCHSRAPGGVSPSTAPTRWRESNGDQRKKTLLWMHRVKTVGKQGRPRRSGLEI
jgi:hypothetical protein